MPMGQKGTSPWDEVDPPIDPVAVEQAVWRAEYGGRKITLSPTECVEAIKLAARKGVSINTLAKFMGWNGPTQKMYKQRIEEST